ncbi:hypothetical protein ASPFODRAFT_53413 [Aspergillus luchuensis CBS 106.47]|uniref:Uncharacterized protein n=1 Tax=Aspergillus luchuensis (strain CBS 106.47) TaxID=1137211 RepID=A0A1M3T0N6_ASPLC|nr:hypothetical protein ASPFODRAFT_53413 [Aspergillus luchuensis CBS 106.47]
MSVALLRNCVEIHETGDAHSPRLPGRLVALLATEVRATQQGISYVYTLSFPFLMASCSLFNESPYYKRGGTRVRHGVTNKRYTQCCVAADYRASEGMDIMVSPHGLKPIFRVIQISHC